MIKNKEAYLPDDLARSVWQVSEQAFEYGSPWHQEQFLADIHNSNSHYWLYEVNEQVVGYLVIHLILDQAEVVNIAVRPTFKGRKIGIALFEESTVYLKGQAVNSLFLEVRETNRPAFNLYQKIGFKTISRRKNYYHHPLEDGLVMLLKID